MMAAVNHVDFDPPSPRPPPIMDELETLALDDDDDSFSPRLLSTVPVAIDGGDPLLRPRPCPPSSSTSSSPSSSPTAAYAAVFDSQNGVGGGGRGGNGADAAAVAAPPSPRRAAVATEFVGITVSEPQKAHDPTASLISGSSTFVTYLITARAADRGGEFRVRRRFRDVVALADRLRGGLPRALRAGAPRQERGGGAGDAEARVRGAAPRRDRAIPAPPGGAPRDRAERGAPRVPEGAGEVFAAIAAG